MKSNTLLLLLLSCHSISSGTVSISNSFVISTTDSTKEAQTTTTVPDSLVNPNIYAMHIQANISNRFATTLVTSKVRNMKNESAETTFSIILPENAFISQFEMEIGGKIYKAYVKEKAEAKKIYEQAVSQGQSAGHVELSARDSKTFTVSVNIEPESKTTFRLIYEELLQRQIGVYDLVVNIHPRQIVDDLKVKVYINESRPLTVVKTPSLQTGNEISKNDDKLNPSADIELINATSAVVTFNPDTKQQKEFAQLLGGNKENGLAGQFIVQYDVERDPQGGEVLVRDGYFVHFFAPSELEPLKKHVVFVLDHSGSMYGRKIEQLTEAMKNILSQLAPTDLFNIVRFNDNALVWNILENAFNRVNLESQAYGNLEPQLKALNLPEAVAATKDNIQKAKTVIETGGHMGITNIIEGLEVGLFLSKRIQEKFPKKYQPMVIFLTDGLPNVGMDSGNDISNTVSKLNSGDNKAIIFSLSFGSGADKDFLRKLSSDNLGFSRHIFAASDSSLQLEDFYRKISSPLLRNVTFKYVDGVTEVTKAHYPVLFKGSELVVAGKTDKNPNVLQHVTANCSVGPIKFNATRTKPISSLERLWAYLTVQQILKERESATNKTDLTQKALNLALKYSFVTSVSSLVVVKPNKTDAVDSKNIEDSNLERSNRGGWSRSSSHFTKNVYNNNFLYVRFGGGRPIPLNVTRAFLRNYAARRRLYSVMSASSSPPPTVTPSLTIRHITPTWLENLKISNGNITTPQGTFKLGNKGDNTTEPPCVNASQNATGVCTILFDCPEIFSVLTDLKVYFQYFCPLNKFAGVCCPKNKVTLGIP